MRSRSSLRGGAVGCALALAACTPDPATGLLVEVDSDLRAELSVVQVRVSRTGWDGPFTVDRALVLGQDGRTLPGSFGIEPRDSGDARPVYVRVSGVLSGGSVEQRVLTGFVRGQGRVVRVFLARECVSPDARARCAMLLPEPGQTCGRGGMCEPIRRDPSTLPPVSTEPARDAGAMDAALDGPASDAPTQDVGGDEPSRDEGSEVVAPNDARDEGGPDAEPMCMGRMCGGSCVDTTSDPANCGACGMRCDALRNVRLGASRCIAGVCQLEDACRSGYANCNSGEPGMGTSDGCESQVTLPTRCGGCSMMCSGSTPMCSEVSAPGGVSRFACTNGCAGMTPDRCDRNCVNLQNDNMNCGMCGRICTAAERADAVCNAGSCGLRCQSGFDNCDGVTGNGCETNTLTSATNCGVCGNACPVRTNALASCSGGMCGSTCVPGFGDCDSMPMNGCESQLSSDVMNCGACGMGCTAPMNGMATCTSGMCGARCNAGFVLVDGLCVGAPLRQLGPLSTTTVGRERPTFRWQLGGGADGARVEVCRDRACSMLVGAFDAPGVSSAPMFTVPAGVNYWRIRGRMGSPSNFVTGYSPVWQFIVPRRPSPTAPDSSYGSRLDVNADGFSDLVVGAYGAGSNNGRVFVYLGNSSGLSLSPSTTLQAGRASDTLFGRVVANLGDVNGDGFGDVGVVTFSGSKVYVFHGTASGLTTMEATIINTPPSTATFGSSLAGVGDVNGDGYGDIVVGASASATAHLFFGSATGVSTSSSVRLSGQVSSQFGASVAGPGDVNGDGLADVVVGAPAESFVYAYLTASPLSITPTSARVILMGNGRAGAAMAAAGDVNADGYPDIVVGEPDATQVRVWRGGPAGFDPSPPAPISLSGNLGFGSAVAGGSDVNGDGYDDIIVGAQSAARAFVFRGNSARTDTSPAPMLEGVSGTGFGIAVAAPGDVDGNGTGEMVVGINNPIGFRIYRSASGMFPSGESTFNAPVVVGGTNNFGSAFGY